MQQHQLFTETKENFLDDDLLQENAPGDVTLNLLLHNYSSQNFKI